MNQLASCILNHDCEGVSFRIVSDYFGALTIEIVGSRRPSLAV